MGLIKKLEELCNILKRKNVEGCLRLKKYNLVKKIIEYRYLFVKPK